jgi:DNA-binding transcriptional regulator PaaX
MTTKQAVNLSLQVIGHNGMDGVVCEATSLPGALVAAGVDKLRPSTLSRVTAELRRQKLVDTKKNGKHLHVQLTVKGIHRLQRSEIDKISIPEPTTWDGLWRMVTYDVPRSQSAQRRLFAQELRRLGIVMIRESVWFHRYPSFDAVLELARYCNLQRHITLAEISRLDQVTLDKLRASF